MSIDGTRILTEIYATFRTLSYYLAFSYFHSMKLHLVNGFLWQWQNDYYCRSLCSIKGGWFRVAVITNDQGQDLVDTYYLRSLGITNNEVTGGCFCCHLANWNQVFSNSSAITILK